MYDYGDEHEEEDDCVRQLCTMPFLVFLLGNAPKDEALGLK